MTPTPQRPVLLLSYRCQPLCRASGTILPHPYRDVRAALRAAQCRSGPRRRQERRAARRAALPAWFWQRFRRPGTAGWPRGLRRRSRAISVTIDGPPENSSPFERAPGARSKSEEFSFRWTINSYRDMAAQSLRPVTKVMHVLGARLHCAYVRYCKKDEREQRQRARCAQRHTCDLSQLLVLPTFRQPPGAPTKNVTRMQLHLLTGWSGTVRLWRTL